MSRNKNTIVHFIHFQLVQCILFSKFRSVFPPHLPHIKKGPGYNRDPTACNIVSGNYRLPNNVYKNLVSAARIVAVIILVFQRVNAYSIFKLVFGNPSKRAHGDIFLYKDNSHPSYFIHSFYSLSSSSFKPFKT